MTRHLVTGGSGFIGAALTRALLRGGHEVRVLDDHSRGALRRLEDVADGVEVVTGDVRDGETVRAAVRGVERVVHLAAVNGTENFYERPELVLDVGVRGMLAVVDACRAEDVGDLVVASSSEVYQSPPRIPTPEDVPLSIPDPANPRYSYAGSKILTELVALHYAEGFDRVVVFRPHNIYGPDMGWEHVIPQLAVQAAELAEAQPDGPLPVVLQGDGTQTRAFMHVDDCARALLLLLEAGGHRETYHVGNPEEVDVRQLAQQIARALGREATIKTADLPAGSTTRRCPDIGKLRSLGFEPRIPLAEGLPPTVRWYADNRSLRPRSRDAW